MTVDYCVDLFVFQDHVTEYKSQDPRVDQEIIDSIDAALFNDDQTFDIVEYHLTVSAGDYCVIQTDFIIYSYMRNRRHRCSFAFCCM